MNRSYALLLVAMLIGFIVAQIARTRSARDELSQMHGEWQLIAMTDNGIEIPSEKCRLTRAVFTADELILPQFWSLAITKIDPVTKAADGFFEGDPGRRYFLHVHPDTPLKEIELTLGGLVPREAEGDLSDEEAELFRKRVIQCRGIYRLDGDDLTICWGSWSATAGSNRPSDFTAPQGSDRVLIVLRREPGK